MCLIAGVNPAVGPSEFYSRPTTGTSAPAIPIWSASWTASPIVFLDSLTDLTRQAMV